MLENSFLVGGDFRPLLITLQTVWTHNRAVNVGPGLCPKPFDTLIMFLKDLFRIKRVNFEKEADDSKS